MSKKVKIKIRRKEPKKEKKAKKAAASINNKGKIKSDHAGTNNLIPAKKGQVLNPKGRPKGSRNKFSESFMRDFLEAWEEGGLVAIKRVRKDDPATFLRVAASILPKEVKIDETDNRTLTEFLDNFKTIEEIDEFIKGITALGASEGSEKAETENEAGAEPDLLH